MGQSGHITLVNGTKYDWKKTYTHEYQMNSWKFPDVIPAGTSVSLKVEFSQAIFKSQSDDAGEVRYSLDGTRHGFEVQARGKDGFCLQVKLTNIETPGNPQDSTIKLGWNHDGSVNFILSGEEGNFTSSQEPAAWMQHNVSLLGGRTLREISIPGSHDAGMSQMTGGTYFAGESNTLTQELSILGQLQVGSRYFDIRPVLGNGKGEYYTGHYSQVTGSWQGTNGQSIKSIIQDVNEFTKTNKELIILNLSHDLNTEVGNRSYRAFNQKEWDTLFEQLKGINDLYVTHDPNVDLTRIKLNDYIGGNKAAVVIVVRPSDKGTTLGAYANQGFYLGKNFEVYDKYSDTNSLKKMSSDQLQKMQDHQGSYFLLSWTLTQGGLQAFSGTPSILNLSKKANSDLYNIILNKSTKQCFPNIMYLDNISYPDDNKDLANIAALAMAINWKIKQ